MAATTQVQILVWTWLVGAHKTYFRGAGAASSKPPMLVTRVQLPACACVAPLAGTNMSVWSMGHRLPAQRAWAMVAGLLLPTPLGWQRATHKHQYPAWTSCVSASSSVCAAGTRQNLFTGLARVLRAFLGPTATEWKYLPLCIDGVSGGNGKHWRM